MGPVPSLRIENVTIACIGTKRDKNGLYALCDRAGFFAIRICRCLCLFLCQEAAAFANEARSRVRAAIRASAAKVGSSFLASQ
ncbi:MAG: hypothetical protein ACI93B_001091 [Yoonia sp.]|jgi:hypothetical protein